jgi:hypothetical protein
MSRLSRMLVCPHCKAPAVTNSAARWSSREHPATCGICGKLSHVAPSSSSGIGILTFVLALVSLAGALASPWWTLAGGCLTVACNRWAWKRVELFPVTADIARKSRVVSRWTNGVALFTWLFS